MRQSDSKTTGDRISLQIESHDWNGASVNLPWFHVHQIACKFLMNGGRYGQEGVDCESAVHR